jgi:hypothetical protein
MATTAKGYTPEQIKAMRDWLTECFEEDLNFDQEDLKDLEVVAGIQKYYAGGIPSFMVATLFWEPNP